MLDRMVWHAGMLLLMDKMESAVKNEIYAQALKEEIERLRVVGERRIQELEFAYQIIDRLLQSEDQKLREMAYNTLIRIIKTEGEI